MSELDNGPIRDAYAVTPSASPLPKGIRGFYVGGAGNVAVVTSMGTTVTFTNCLAGIYYPVACTYVLSAGTTASNIVGLV